MTRSINVSKCTSTLINVFKQSYILINEFKQPNVALHFNFIFSLRQLMAVSEKLILFKQTF